ncbi:roadblock/LC7 domain-containing protein [Streptomyces sp. AN091965]|uniref:roadblock/LC7 domain-containing protein n=1 Tax=Streptomyces sp. AN091965 TaxID=2927803 RepID=UPI001F60F18B|nr:roadblock/LC7 domain-containing protein [Streptomyces sp. AN091965]MCI3930940.1 roadblock/LC7 domain-containing protein [Streptomyces sp. AN091965]
MAVEPDVLDELGRLRARIPQLTGALAADAGGRVLARDTTDEGAQRLAALTVDALLAALRLADAAGQGRAGELLVRGEGGYVAAYAAGPTAVLALLAEPRVNVGRLHLEGRRAGARIGDLLDGALERLENT